MTSNKVCVVCGKEYKYCHDCNHKTPESWKGSFCSTDCRDLYRTVASYGMNKISKEEAKAELGKLNIPDLSKSSASTRKLVNEINATPVNNKVEEKVEKVLELPNKKQTRFVPSRQKGKKR